MDKENQIAWRNTFKPARFFILDVRVGVIILLSLIHIRLWTIALDVVVIAIGIWIERIGMGFEGAMRAVREAFAGRVRPALPSHKIRGMVDFGRRRMAWEPEPEKGVHQLTPVEAKRPDID